jgi:hypothetical protein
MRNGRKASRNYNQAERIARAKPAFLIEMTLEGKVTRSMGLITLNEFLAIHHESG